MKKEKEEVKWLLCGGSLDVDGGWFVVLVQSCCWQNQMRKLVVCESWQKLLLVFDGVREIEGREEGCSLVMARQGSVGSSVMKVEEWIRRL